MNSESSPRAIKLPSQRLCNLAATLLKLHPLHDCPLPSTSTSTSAPPIRIVCISDTHNTQPALPAGDILIHAGDLTQDGSFDELQSQVAWLSSQPHRYKLLVAGNHDVLLDEDFLEAHPERRYGQTWTPNDLDWGSVRYLQDSSTTLHLPAAPLPSEQGPDGRSTNRGGGGAAQQAKSLVVYGSPRTPQFSISAFQYPPERDLWAGAIPTDADVVITHGPPQLHLDAVGVRRAGCPFLTAEVARVRPRLVVFGHIHVGYGREDVVLDAVRRAYEDIRNDQAGWGTLLCMAFSLVLARLRLCFGGRERMMRAERVTTFVNAAVVDGAKNELRNEPVVIDL